MAPFNQKRLDKILHMHMHMHECISATGRNYTVVGVVDVSVRITIGIVDFVTILVMIW